MWSAAGQAPRDAAQVDAQPRARTLSGSPAGIPPFVTSLRRPCGNLSRNSQSLAQGHVAPIPRSSHEIRNGAMLRRTIGGESEGLSVVPRQPFSWRLLGRCSVALKSDQVLERVSPAFSCSMDEAHDDITNVSAT